MCTLQRNRCRSNCICLHESVDLVFRRNIDRMLSESFLVCLLVHHLLLACQAQNNCHPEGKPSTSDKYHTDLWGFKSEAKL